MNNLRLAVEMLQATITNTREEIAIKTTTFFNTDELIEAQNSAINKILEDIRLLEDEVPRFEQLLQNAFNAGNDINTEVLNARDNLDAIIARLDSESRFLNDATRNLETARAEKELADLAMEELLQAQSNVLPFSIVPNGNGETEAGSPAGNNPSGSPLGPVESSNVSARDIQNRRGGSLTHYLSGAYASGSDPARPETANRLFPFSIYALNRGNDFSCNSRRNNNVSFEGKIKMIDGNTITVEVG